MRSAGSLSLSMMLSLTGGATRPASALKSDAKAKRGQHEKKAADARAPGDVVYLDPLIHERTRLSILTTLFTSTDSSISFSDLRDTLSLTDGNLTTHLRTLEGAGLLERAKEGSGRNSSTTVRLSPTGKKSFMHYLDQLETLVRAARGK
jgi:DNA-binding MarR family transcriptional regulator